MVKFKKVSLVEGSLSKEFLNPQERNAVEHDEDEEVEIAISPRSYLACEMQGVTPDELIYLPISNFREKGLLEEQISMRYNFHERRRQEKLRGVMKQRKKNLEIESKTSRSLVTPRSTSTTPRRKDHEFILLEKLKKKQQREIEAYLEYELRIADINKIQERKQEILAEKEKRRLEEVELKRQREEYERERRREKRRETEESIRKEQEKRTERLLEKSRRREELDAIREDERARQIEERERRMRERAERREEKIQQIQKEQEYCSQKKKEEMEQREKKRSQVMNRSRIALSRAITRKIEKNKIRYDHQMSNMRELEDKQREQILEKQRIAEARRLQMEAEKAMLIEEAHRRAVEKETMIQKVLETSKELENQRIMQVKRKKEQFEQRMQELEAIKEEELKYKRLEEEEKEQKRQETIQKAEELEKKRRVCILEKRIKLENSQKRKRDLLKKQQDLKLEERRLKDIEKQENVRRLKRIEEFQRKQLLAKILDEEERTEQFRNLKDKEQRERSRIKQEVSIQREKIKELLERMKQSKYIDTNEINSVIGLDASTILEKLQRSSSNLRLDQSFRDSTPVRSANKRSNSFSEKDNGMSQKLGTPRTPNKVPSSKLCSRTPEAKKPITNTNTRAGNVDPIDEYLNFDDDILYEYRQLQNDKLLEILRQEREKEYEREQILRQLDSPQQRKMMIDKFNMERIAANSKILEFAAQQDKQLTAVLINHIRKQQT